MSMERQCECIKHEIERMKLRHNTDKVFEDGWNSHAVFRAFPKRKDGEYYERGQHDAVEFRFCPLCGKPYKKRELPAPIKRLADEMEKKGVVPFVHKDGCDFKNCSCAEG